MALEINEIIPMLYRPRLKRGALLGHMTRNYLGSENSPGTSGYLTFVSGSQYRIDVTDSSGYQLSMIYDGPACWVGADISWRQAGSGTERTPFSELVQPSWLLADFDLELAETTTHLGRRCCAIRASRRETSVSRSSLTKHPSHVSALVDEETGLLLRCEIMRPDDTVEIIEFTDITASSELPDPGLFEPAHRDETATGAVARTHPGEPGSGTADISDQLVRILCRAGMNPQTLAAELHEWTDEEANVRAASAQIERSDAPQWIQMVGRLTTRQDFGQVNLAAHLQIKMPGRYRIDFGQSSPSKTRNIICDGRRLWTVYADRIVDKASAPLPAGISLLIDLSWLLSGYELSSVDTGVSADGRNIISLSATPASDRQLRQGPLSKASFSADHVKVTVDAKLCIGTGLEWSFNGHLISRSELSGIVEEVSDTVFDFELPAGHRVLTDPHPLAEASFGAGPIASQFGEATARALAHVARLWRGERQS